MKKKVFISGGHVTPAIALIDELAKDKTLTIVFVGRKSAAEHSLISEKGIRFLPIAAGKRSWSTFTNIPIGCIQALYYSLKEKPDVIVSFGGYVALPVALAGWMLGVPVLTHEQTLTLGLANRIIARIAKRVCLTHKETLQQFPSGVVTGLPMRKELFLEQKKPAYNIDERNFPILYITGGSQGARSLNEKIADAIPELIKSYTVIHQTGPMVYKSAKRYIVKKTVSAADLSWILQHTMIVIGRSGANTVMECAALGKVAVFVPLPWSADNEQLFLARWLVARGGADIIEQHMLDSKTLVRHIQKIRADFETLQKRAETFSHEIPRDGAKRLAREVRSLL